MENSNLKDFFDFGHRSNRPGENLHKMAINFLVVKNRGEVSFQREILWETTL